VQFSNIAHEEAILISVDLYQIIEKIYSGLYVHRYAEM